jgi:deaminated glutathione amidase
MASGESTGERVLRAAAIQMNSHEDVASNLASAEGLVERAARAGAELVVLPECFSFLGPEKEKARHAERLDDERAPMQGAVKSWSRRHRITIIAGGMPEASSDAARPYNSSIVFGPDGQLRAVYRKVHMFDVDLADGASLRESDGTMPGTETVVTEVGGFGVGLSICYDVRFPELYRALVDRGASVLTVPAAFTLHTGRDHWHLLLRARAVESQSWVVAAGQWGVHTYGGQPSKRVSFGHSLIIDPWGTVVADCSDGPGFVVADLPQAQIERVRASVPSLRHRKLG